MKNRCRTSRVALILILTTIQTQSPVLAKPQSGAQAKHCSVVALDASRFKEMIEGKKSSQIVDIRSSDVSRGRTIVGAILYPYNRRTGKFQMLSRSLDSLDKSKATFVYGSNTEESAMAAKALSTRGFQKVLFLNGGFQSWTASGYHYIDHYRQYWDEYYRGQNDAHRPKQPNQFFKKHLKDLKPGRLLLPGEGEGNNAIWAAKSGWQVDAFDISEEARKIALQMAERERVSISYSIADFEKTPANKNTYDLVAIIDLYILPSVRRQGMQTALACLKKRGSFLLVGRCAAPAQDKGQSRVQGTKSDPDLLWDLEEIKTMLKGFQILNLEFNDKKSGKELCLWARKL